MNDELVQRLEEDTPRLAKETVELLKDRGAFERYGPVGESKCRDDTVHHLQYLAAALSSGDEQEFVEYRSWLVSVLTARGIPEHDVDDNFDALAHVLRENYQEAATPAIAMLASR